MPCRGVFFAITDKQAVGLVTAKNDAAALELIQKIEAAWDEDNLAECDKAWDAMHRLLTDGQLKPGNGPEPFCHCVIGPHQLHKGGDHILSIVSPIKVKEIAQALSKINKHWFDDRYQRIVPSNYAPEYGEQDCEYTWEWFESVRSLYKKAAKDDRWVVFSVAL